MKRWLAFSLFVVLLAGRGAAQGAQESGAAARSVPDPLGRVAKWDPVHQTLLYYSEVAGKDQESSLLFEHGAEAIRVDLLRDFPDARRIRIEDAAGAPDQGILLDTVIEYPSSAKGGAPESNRLVLFYDARGRLTREWDPSPFACRNIATDREGNIYCFGHQAQAGGMEAAESGLLRKYSPEGDLAGEYLPRSLFPPGIDAIAFEGNSGANRLLVTQSGKIILYAASSKEILRLDPDSQHLERMPVDRILNSLHYPRPEAVAVKTMAEENDGSMLAELAFTEAPRPGARREGGSIMLDKIVEFTGDLRRAAEWADMTSNPRWLDAHFLGADDEGRLLFLRKNFKDLWSLDSYDKASMGKLPPRTP